MSSKTKIIVLHMKELLYTALFTILGIALIVMLFIVFSPSETEPSQPESSSTPSSESSVPPTESVYIPGLYNTELLLNDQAINVEVIVNSDKIASLKLVELSETVKTMYPLLQPTFEDLSSQILEKQSLSDISYDQEHRYTSLVLLEAISNALKKASP